MAEEKHLTLLRRLFDLLAGEPMANLAVVVAIGIGFIHGWLKLKVPSPVTTFAFDIPLVLALVLVLPRTGSLLRFFPPSRTGPALVVFYGVLAGCGALALVLPGGAPALAAAAAFRAWAFSSLMFGLGYQIIKSERQLHGYFLLIILFGAATSLYAVGQSDEEVRAMAAMDPALALRIRGQAFVNAEGEAVLRRFSTFISSGAFGATMSSILLFAAALMTDRRVPLVEKMVLGALTVLIGWGMFLSGARSAMLTTVFGVFVLGWFRRSPLPLVGLVGVLGLSLLLGVGSTGGGTVDRISSLDLITVWKRFYIVWSPGLHYLIESGLVGGGLGRSTTGLPSFLYHLMDQYDVWGVDGDLGRLMAETGIVGTLTMAWLFSCVVRDAFGLLRRQRETSAGTLSLGAVVCFLVTLVTFPVGSPFLGIPMGALTWFLLGAAFKMDELGLAPAQAVAGIESSQRASEPSRRRAFMFRSDRPTGGAILTPGEAIPAGSGAGGAAESSAGEPMPGAPGTGSSAAVPPEGPVSPNREPGRTGAKRFLYRG